MTNAEVEASEETLSGARNRRCIVTGDILPEGRLLRFVAGPDGTVVPDVQAKLPGRGMWVRSEREAVETAVKKRLFARAAKAQVTAPEDLAARTESLLAERMLSQLGLARRAGHLILGFDQVERALRGDSPPVVIVQAADSSAEGGRKLMNAAQSRPVVPFVIGMLTNAELSLATGKGNVVHAAIAPGHIAERLIFEALRLQGFRPKKPWPWAGFAGDIVGGVGLAPQPLP